MSLTTQEVATFQGIRGIGDAGYGPESFEDAAVVKIPNMLGRGTGSGPSRGHLPGRTFTLRDGGAHLRVRQMGGGVSLNHSQRGSSA